MLAWLAERLLQQVQDAFDRRLRDDVAKARPGTARSRQRHGIGLIDLAYFLASGILQDPGDVELAPAVVDGVSFTLAATMKVSLPPA